MAFIRMRTVIEAIVALGICCIFVARTFDMYDDYPHNYSWSELLINYQGGFIRRGLLGEIAYDVRWLVSPRLFLTALIATVSCATIVGLVLLTRRANALAALTFLLSPGGLLFPIYDPEAFGRKDAVILAMLPWTAWVCTRLCSTTAFAALVLTLFALGFIVETMWLYLPVCVALYCWTRGRDAPRRWHVTIWVAVSVGLALCSAVTVVANHGVTDPAAALAQKQAIVASWEQISPGTTFDADALNWLGMSLAAGVRMALSAKGERSMSSGYAIAFIFSLVPTGLCLLQARAPRVGTHIWVPAVGAFVVMTATFLLGADWGRYIHLWTMYAFVFVLLVSSPIATQVAQQRDRASLAIAIVLVVVYSTTWRLKHYVWSGDSPFVPGAVFLLVRAAAK